MHGRRDPAASVAIAGRGPAVDDHEGHQTPGENRIFPQEQDRPTGVLPTQPGRHAVRGQTRRVAIKPDATFFSLTCRKAGGVNFSGSYLDGILIEIRDHLKPQEFIYDVMSMKEKQRFHGSIYYEEGRL